MVAPRPGESAEQRRQADRVRQIGRALRELGIHWSPAYSPQAKGRVERSFGTDQDRLVKYRRLAQVKTRQRTNELLETDDGPEWNERFAQRPAQAADLHRPLTPQIDWASALSHVESRVIANDDTISFAGRRFQIARQDATAGMKRRHARVELRLDGSLKARYEGHYREIAACGEKTAAPPPAPRKPPRKDHNANGKSHWMDGFFERPGPPLWLAIRDANAGA